MPDITIDDKFITDIFNTSSKKDLQEKIAPLKTKKLSPEEQKTIDKALMLAALAPESTAGVTAGISDVDIIVSGSVKLIHPINKWETIAQLLPYASKIGKMINEALTHAAQHGKIEIMRDILNNKNPDDDSKKRALFFAVNSGNEDSVKLLLEHEPNPETVQVLITQLKEAAKPANDPILTSLEDYIKRDVESAHVHLHV